MIPKNLLSILPPPIGAPIYSSKPDWSHLENQLQTSLPQDYKEFIEFYGSGYLGNSQYSYTLEFLDPFSSDIARSFYEFYLEHKILRETGYFHEAVFPEPRGVIPWALDSSGKLFCWVCEGEPDEWWTITIPSIPEHIDEFDLSFTEFLAAYLSHEIEPRDVYPAGDPPFRYVLEPPQPT